MNQNDFVCECEKRLLSPEIVLESENVRYCLAKRLDLELLRILDIEFKEQLLTVLKRLFESEVKNEKLARFKHGAIGLRGSHYLL